LSEDPNFHERLIRAAAMALDRDVLDVVREKLSEQGGGSMPLTVKYVFTINEDGELEARVDSTFALSTLPKKFKIEQDGKQLPIPSLKNAKRKETPKREAAKRLESAISTGAETRAGQRIAKIQEENLALYESGAITKKQAMMSGIPEEML
jgi:hypothetical protein